MQMEAREDDEVQGCTYGLGCIAEARPQKVSNRVADLSDVPSLRKCQFQVPKSEDGSRGWMSSTHRQAYVDAQTRPDSLHKQGTKDFLTSHHQA